MHTPRRATTSRYTDMRTGLLPARHLGTPPLTLRTQLVLDKDYNHASTNIDGGARQGEIARGERRDTQCRRTSLAAQTSLPCHHPRYVTSCAIPPAEHAQIPVSWSERPRELAAAAATVVPRPPTVHPAAEEASVRQNLSTCWLEVHALRKMV